MSRLGTLVAGFALTFSVAACAGEDSLGRSQAEIQGVVGLEAMPESAQPRGIYFIVPPNTSAKTPRLGPGPQRRIIYMNRNGGTYTPANNDNSSTNQSIVPNQTSQVSAWSYGDAAWQQLMTCVRSQYARFDVEITDVDPGNVPHIESVTGGSPAQVGLPSNVGGVSPFTNDCSTVEQAVTYTFAGIYQGNIQAICEVVAQETSHAFGLDHEYLCEDPMTYLGGCGPKTFQDQTVACGEDGPRACACGGQQNSVQGLYQVLGPADDQAPTCDLTLPLDGSTVAPGFAIAASASDNLGVTKVDLYIDGALVTTAAAAPYTFTAPATLAAGAHSVEVRAYDSGGKITTDIANVTLATGGGGDGGGDGNGEGNGDGNGDGDGSGGGAGGDDEVGAPPTVFGGCSAAGGHSERGIPALLLMAAALLLAYRRRA